MGDSNEEPGHEAFLKLHELLLSKQRLQESLEGAGSNKSSLKDASPELVLGVVADIGLPKGAVTVAGYANGDARLYFSEGGGLTGDLSQLPEVNEAARALVAAGQPLVPRLMIGTTRQLPANGTVRFSILTPGGPHIAEVDEASLLDAGNPLYRLYGALQTLADALDSVNEKIGGSRA